ncbi:MAG: hypothetical protein U0441_27905 [Polyangiaceae bacterium]
MKDNAGGISGLRAVDAAVLFVQDPWMRSLLSCALLLAPVALTACSGVSGSDTTSTYVLPTSLDALSEATFFDHPWPSDLRLVAGSPQVKGYYNPKNVPIISQYIDAIEGKLDGFSPAAAGFLRFDQPIDEESLPADPKAALDAGASVQLINVDPKSADVGKRALVSLYFRKEAGAYWLPNTLAFMPTIGFPLQPHTKYALVVTDKLLGENGSPVKAGADLQEVLGLTTPTERSAPARQLFESSIVEVEKAGVSRKHIVHFTAFTTADPTAELYAVADDVLKNIPAPQADPLAWEHTATLPSYETYIGSYGPSPNYQAGKLPFSNYGDGGNFNIVDGKPKAVDTFPMRFALAVPKPDKCPMPKDGYPIVLYAHGTGGYYESFLEDGTARVLAKRCLASMGVDQIFHGARPGAPPPGSGSSSVEVLFFNFENPVAARTNPRQGAVDEVQRQRLFTETKITVPAGVSATGAEVKFDPAKVLYFGHSQGGLSGPMFLASNSALRGGVLSGSSAVFGITLLEKTKPDPSIKQLVSTVFLQLNVDEAPELNVFHPAISLAQSIVDVADTYHYARFLATSPRQGFAAKSIYMTEGINPDGVGDSYAPPHGIEAHSIAAGLPMQLPGQKPIVETQYGGPQAVTVPAEGLAGNIGGGAASGILAQWPVSPGDDGHFVIFDDPDASNQAADFLLNLANDPKGRVPAP